MNFLLILITLSPDDVRVLLREYSCSSLLGEKSKRRFPSSFPLITPCMERTTPGGQPVIEKRTDEPTNRRSNWRTDGRTNGRTNRQTDGVLNGRTDVRMDRKTDRPTDGSIEKRTGGQTSERTDRGKYKQRDGRTDSRQLKTMSLKVSLWGCLTVTYVNKNFKPK